MCADRSRHPVVHLVGSVPLPDCDSIFRTVAAGVGPHLARLPDGETGKRKMWIKFLQDVLAENPAIEVAHDLAPFKFTQWDGKVIREIPRLRIKKGAVVDPKSFVTGYADMRSIRLRVSTSCEKETSSRRGSSSRSACRPRWRRPTTTWCRATGRH